MSRVCGYQRKCGDEECPYSVCVGCPIAEYMDEHGIEAGEELMDALEKEGE